MDIVSLPKVIVVCFHVDREEVYEFNNFRTAGCLLRVCILPELPTPSFVYRMLRDKNSYAPMIVAAYEFVTMNYRVGDHVVILDTFESVNTKFVLDGQQNRHAAIRELSTALDTGSLHYSSRRGVVGKRIPIKCVFLRSSYGNPLGWSGFDQLLSDLPSSVENVLCFHRRNIRSYDAYAIERGSHGRIKRKECWNSPGSGLSAHDWVAHQTSHIIRYGSSIMISLGPIQSNLLSAVTYSN
ncbi:hypothetical protein BDV93DRAFT_611601, partial [Ceratobasidium sp. AG-I]